MKITETYCSDKIRIELLEDFTIDIIINETGEIRQFCPKNNYKYKKKDYPKNYETLNVLYTLRRALTEAIKIEKGISL